MFSYMIVCHDADFTCTFINFKLLALLVKVLVYGVVNSTFFGLAEAYITDMQHILS